MYLGLEELRTISCGICYTPYTTESENEEQQPQKFCRNNHIFCNQCCSTLKECPICFEEQILTPTLEKENIQKVIAKREKILAEVPIIQIDEFKFLKKHPVAYGSFADVYHCKWGNTVVALKYIRRNPKTNKMDDIKLEAALCFKMRHGNIVTFFGLTKLEKNFFGLVLEWADQGDLQQNMKDLQMDQKIKISLCICEGLSYMHSIQIAHCDLQPENVLLFGDKSLAKISGFGTSKIIQTIIPNSGIAGTATNWAPELMGVGKQVKQFKIINFFVS
jgi:hypothetical protein